MRQHTRGRNKAEHRPMKRQKGDVNQRNAFFAYQTKVLSTNTKRPNNTIIHRTGKRSQLRIYRTKRIIRVRFDGSTIVSSIRSIFDRFTGVPVMNSDNRPGIRLTKTVRKKNAKRLMSITLIRHADDSHQQSKCCQARLAGHVTTHTNWDNTTNTNKQTNRQNSEKIRTSAKLAFENEPGTRINRSSSSAAASLFSFFWF